MLAVAAPICLWGCLWAWQLWSSQCSSLHRQTEAIHMQAVSWAVEQVILQGIYGVISLSVINSSHQLLLANCYMCSTSCSPRQLCSRSVTQPRVKGQAAGTVELLWCHSREAGERDWDKSLFVGLQESSGKVLCWRCYCRRYYGSSFGLFSLDIIRQL